MNLKFTTKSQLEAMPIPTLVTLASQSIGRKQLLEKLGITFRVVLTNINEDAIIGSDPIKTLEKRAAAKLDEVINHQRVYMLDEKVHHLVIAADSMAIVGKKFYGKSSDREHSREILKELMDRTHTFATAVDAAFIESGKGLKKRWSKIQETKVTMRKLTNPELDLYISRYDFSKFAGGYALNEAPWDLVTKVDGSYTNVIGMPFEILLPILRSLDIIAPPNQTA